MKIISGSEVVYVRFTDVYPKAMSVSCLVLLLEA